METAENQQADASLPSSISEKNAAELIRIYALTSDLLSISTPQGYFTHVNPAFTRLLGYTEKELTSQHFVHFVHPDDVERTAQVHEQILKDQKVDHFENRFLTKDSSYCWLLWSYVASTDLGNWFAIAKDITVLKNTEKALAESSYKNKLLFDRSPLAQYIYDSDSHKILEANEAALNHYGYSKSEFLSLSLADLLSEKGVRDLNQILAQLRETGTSISFTTQHKKKNGVAFPVEVSTSLFKWGNQLVGLAVVNDITDNLKLREQLKQEREQKEKQMAKAVFSAQKREKEFIGRELHDNINQILASVKITLEYVKETDENRQELLQKCINLTNNAIEEIRALSKSLVTPGMKGVSLKAAINELVRSLFQKDNIKTNLKVDKKLERLPDAYQLTIFRIVQEQLNNIKKHAAAHRVWVSLLWEDQLTLLIKDDGKGIDPTKKESGIGLQNIKARVAFYDGSIAVVSAPGQGYTLAISIPPPLYV